MIKKQALVKGGRPTVMTEAVVGKLHNAFAIGATVEEACRFAGISRDAFYEHSKKNPEFTDTIEGVKDRPILKAKSKMAVELSPSMWRWRCSSV